MLVFFCRCFVFLAKIGDAVIRKYSCNHTDLLAERMSNVADDINSFLALSTTTTMYVPFVFIRNTHEYLFFIFFENLFSLVLVISSPSSFDSAMASNERNENKSTPTAREFDADAYRRASLNDFFSKAFGPSQSDLKVAQPHSLRSSVEHMAGGFVRDMPEKNSPKEVLASIKEDMRKTRTRVDTKH
jgi:hypothetical protein